MRTAREGNELILRLRIGARWPNDDRSCEWSLLDRSGRIQQSGQSEPVHWPVAGNCEVILTGAQCATHTIALPSGTGSRKLPRQAMEFALEEQVLGDMADEHWVIVSKDEKSQLNVLLIERKRLRLILDALDQLDRPPQRVIWEPHLLPVSDDAWTVLFDPAECSGYLDTGRGLAWFFDGTLDQFPALIALAVAAAGTAGSDPQKLLVCASGDVMLDLTNWNTGAGMPCVSIKGIDWRNAPAGRAVDLLAGEFASRSSFAGAAAAFRPALLLALAGLAFFLFTGLVEWGALAFRQRDTRQQMVTLFQSTFPDQRTLIDPYRQMRTQLDRLRRAHGLVATSDFPALLVETRAVLGSDEKLARMKYDNGRLEVELAPGNRVNKALLIAAFERRGLTVGIADGQATHADGSIKVLRIAY